MKHFFTLILITAFAGMAIGQVKLELPQASSPASIATQLSKGEIVASAAVGFAGTKHVQYERFEKLLSVATVPDLVSLIEHRSPIVRCYAYWGLLRTDKNSATFALEILSKDNAIVETMQGCVIQDMTVAAFCSSRRF